MYFVPLEPFVVALLLYWAMSLSIEGLVLVVNRFAKERGLGDS